MKHHDCRPPGGRQPIELNRWTCPDCGDVWEARPLGSVEPAQSNDFATGEQFTNAEWVRVRSGETSPQVLVGTFGGPEGTELRCSFCEKQRSSVRKLISGPGTGSSRVLICNECVDLCVEIIAEEQAEIEAEQDHYRRTVARRPASASTRSGSPIIEQSRPAEVAPAG